MAESFFSKVRIGPCTLSLRKGKIEESKEDAVVNSTNATIDLETNASSSALAAVAGPELQIECSKLGGLKKGEVKVSKPYKLQCKSVLHCWIGKGYDDKQYAKDLEEAIMGCLHAVDQQLNYKSIAFPAVGTGSLGFPAEIVARYFVRCMTKYTSINTVESLKDVCIVVFPGDEPMYEQFMMVLKQYRDSKWSGPGHFMNKLNDGAKKETLVTLNLDSREYMEVEDNFSKTIPRSTVTILEIKRIQNFTQWVKYNEHLRHVSNTHKKADQDIERILWHGTSEDAVPNIAQKFFNRSYAGQNGTKYGKGVYFARDSSYSDLDCYSKPNSAGEKFMFQARVVVGKYTRGDRNLIDAPETDSGISFDSVVDDVENPRVFVVFQDAAAYPEYIIKYLKNQGTDEEMPHGNTSHGTLQGSTASGQNTPFRVNRQKKCILS